MDHDPRAYLWDAREGADAIASFVRGRTFQDDRADVMLRSAVERQFEIIGEALRRLKKAAPDPALRASRARKGDRAPQHSDPRLRFDRRRRRAIQQSLPALRARLAGLLDEAGNA